MVRSFSTKAFDLLFLLGDDGFEAGHHFPVLRIVAGKLLQPVQFSLDVLDAALDHLHLVQAGGSLFQVGPQDGGGTGDQGEFLQDVVHGGGLLDIAVARHFRAGLEVFVGLDHGVVILFGDGLAPGDEEITGGGQDQAA